MIAEAKVDIGITESKIEQMRKEVTIPVTIDNETHDFVITLRYEERDDSHCDRVFNSYQIEGKTQQEAWSDYHNDYTEGLNENLGEWLDECFTLDKEQSNEELEQLFNILWGVLEDENLAY